jgi:hypothetical protein
VLVFFSEILAHSITPKVAKAAAKVAKRATAALVSIMLGLIFSPKYNIAREHIRVWVK